MSTFRIEFCRLNASGIILEMISTISSTTATSDTDVEESWLTVPARATHMIVQGLEGNTSVEYHPNAPTATNRGKRILEGSDGPAFVVAAGGKIAFKEIS